MERVFFLVSGVLFGVVALVHLLRALNDWAFVIGTWQIPTVASWLGFVVTALLCAWALRLATR